MDICKNSDYMTQAFLAQVAILVQTITSEFLNWTGRCCLYPIAGSAVLLLLAGNCLPYHQPKFLITKDSKKALGLSRFPLTLPGGVSFRQPPYIFPPFKCVVPLQHSSIRGVGPYCGLTVHEAEVLVPEPPPLGDPVDRHP